MFERYTHAKSCDLRNAAIEAAAEVVEAIPVAKRGTSLRMNSFGAYSYYRAFEGGFQRCNIPTQGEVVAMKRPRRDWTAWSDSNVAGRTKDRRRSTQRGAGVDMMDRRRRETNHLDG